VDIARTADTTAVVLVPGLGDDIQAIKAGILEIADVFVVNKAERDGADRAVAELSMMLDFAPHEAWRPPIVKTSAPQAAGVPELVQALEAHGRFLEESGEAAARRAGRARSRLLALLEGRFRRAVEARAPEPDGLEEAVRSVAARAEDPYAAADRLFEGVVRRGATAAGRRP
jgi:LAO/AO transport system kinase